MADPSTSPAMSALHRDLIEAAITAPSPDNNQPWLFQSRGERLAVFLDPSRSLPSDVASMFDMTAIGAAVENVVIAATQHHQIADVAWLAAEDIPQSPKQPIAEIELQPGGTPDPLSTAIPKRCTCRKPYATQPPEPALLRKLESSLMPFPQTRVDWLTSDVEKARFGKMIAQTDSLRFRTKPFHEELFHQLRFRPSEAEATRDGLDIRTLELPPGVATLLKSLRSWRAMQAIHTLRLTSLLTMPSKLAVQNSGAIAVISVSTASPASFFSGGRAIQRLWLTAADNQLSVQPLGSLPIFLLQSEPRQEFRKAIENTRREVADLLPGLGERVIQLALRIGHSAPPTQRSLRRYAAEVTL